MLQVHVHAPNGRQAQGVAVLDTGASLSAVDRAVAAELDLPSSGAARWSAVSDTGDQAVAPLRRGALRLADDPRLFELQLLEIPKLRDAVGGLELLALLGWDFLDQCRLTCDGPAGTFALTLPHLVGPAHRRR